MRRARFRPRAKPRSRCCRSWSASPSSPQYHGGSSTTVGTVSPEQVTPKTGDLLGIECELCSSDGPGRDDRTFVYSSPTAVDTPAAFGRVQLVDHIELAALQPLGRVLLPLAVTKAANYPWLYATLGVSPTLEGFVAKVEGKLLDPNGKLVDQNRRPAKPLNLTRQEVDKTGFAVWTGKWELYDVPSGDYTLEFRALDRNGNVLTSRTEKVRHNLGGTP
jgi:hypothetical protein